MVPGADLGHGPSPQCWQHYPIPLLEWETSILPLVDGGGEATGDGREGRAVRSGPQVQGGLSGKHWLLAPSRQTLAHQGASGETEIRGHLDGGVR